MAARATSGRWLFGPAPDLLLGCGLGYALLFVAFAASGLERATTLGLGLVPLVSILTGTPHYGATLLRVYEDRAERRRYAFFAVWLTLVLWTLFYVGLYNALLGSLIVTLYLTWSPWHYTGQNYGIAVMFLRRRGVPLAAATKRLLYLSFLLSYGMTFVALHGAGSDGTYSAFTPYDGGTFQLLRLGIPSPLWQGLFVALGVAYLGLLALAGRALLRGASARDLLPVACLALTQALWFSLPAAARYAGWLGPEGVLSTDKAAYAFFWIATGHSVQYLWITTFFAAGARPSRERAWFLAKTLAAGSFIWSVPGLVYGLSVEGGPLGGVARGPDVFVLLAAMVNLHHFVLDGAIWKLRDGPVARVLIRSEPEAPATPPALGLPRPRRWLAPVVYGLGTLATFQVLSSLVEHAVFFQPALERGDLRGAEKSLERLRWIRSDSHADYLRLANAAAARDVHRLAARAYDTSLKKHPSRPGYVGVGRLAQKLGDERAAVAAFEQASAVDPRHPEPYNLAGIAWLSLGETERAEAAFLEALARAPGNAVLESNLARVRLRRERAPAPEPPAAEDAPTAVAE